MNIPLSSATARFSSYSFLLVVIFVALMDVAIRRQDFLLTLSVGVVFCILMYANASVWSQLESDSCSAMIIGLVYHVILFLIINAVQFIWVASLGIYDWQFFGLAVGSWMFILIGHAALCYFLSKPSSDGELEMDDLVDCQLEEVVD